MRYSQSEIDQLLDHLQNEFGQHGRRAADLLVTSRKLLEWVKGHEAAAPRIGDAVIYCLREVMAGILESQNELGPSWNSVSREVVDAKKRYESVRGSGTDEQRSLTDLLKKIDDLAEFHEQKSVHEQRLIAVMLDRAGSTPLDGTSSVRKYQRMVKHLNSGVHGSVAFDVDQAASTWSECVALLCMLFLPDLRYRELEKLARIEQPNPKDVGEISELVVTPSHLRYFLARIERPIWLDKLTESGLLDLPHNGGGWPAFVSAGRLARQYPSAVVHWLETMYSRMSKDAKYASQIGDAALAIGEIGLPLVRRIVRQRSSEPDVVRLAWDAARSAHPSTEVFESFVDIVFSQESDAFAWTFGEIAERFVSGIDSGNAMRRLRLLCWKIRSTPASDLVRSWNEIRPQGSIADRYDEAREERFDVLIDALIRATLAAQEWLDTTCLLKLMDTLPGMIGIRMRLWLLGNSTAIGVGVLVKEVADAIRRRRPNGDDVALIDRVVQETDTTQYIDRWREALGPAPDVEDVGRALSADEPREEWLRAYYWFPLLAGVTAGPWEDVLAVLSARYGVWSREPLMMQRSAGTIAWADSPISSDELASVSPEEACRRISRWTPQEDEWMVSARALSQTLERVVSSNPSEWVRNPLRIATALRHPTYIHRYLRAIQGTLSEGLVPVEGLIRLIALLRTHPWKAVPLGRDQFDYDSDWTNVDGATIDIIESLAEKDIGFAGRSNEVWAMLESAVKDNSGFLEDVRQASRDPLDTAINMPWTRALRAALGFMEYEFRSNECIRSDGLRLLEEILKHDGDKGLYCRAILAPAIGFLRHAAREWVKSNQDLLLGEKAPSGLAQKTLDQALKWGQPNRWLLEEFRCGVLDAVGRAVERALDHFLIAVLLDLRGYSLNDAANFLKSQPELLSSAGDRLGYLLDSDEAKRFHVERASELWQIMISDDVSVDGLAGFGRFAHVALLDDTRWSELTLKTLRRTGGHIDEPHMVAERAAGLVPSETTLEIMDDLVRRSSTRARQGGERNRACYRAMWYQQEIEKAAVELLRRSSDLKNSDKYRRLRTAMLERGADMASNSVV